MENPDIKQISVYNCSHTDWCNEELRIVSVRTVESFPLYLKFMLLPEHFGGSLPTIVGVLGKWKSTFEHHFQEGTQNIQRTERNPV